MSEEKPELSPDVAAFVANNIKIREDLARIKAGSTIEDPKAPEADAKSIQERMSATKERIANLRKTLEDRKKDV
jgi:hypothetical protein